MEEPKARSRRRPLVRAASEESSSDLSSVTVSPSPGDTLPWNLPKHHRMKRSKSASGDVLDPAERAVIRIAGMGFLFFFSQVVVMGGQDLWFLVLSEHKASATFVWSSSGQACVCFIFCSYSLIGLSCIAAVANSCVVWFLSLWFCLSSNIQLSLCHKFTLK